MMGEAHAVFTICDVTFTAPTFSKYRNKVESEGDIFFGL